MQYQRKLRISYQVLSQVLWFNKMMVRPISQEPQNLKAFLGKMSTRNDIPVSGLVFIVLILVVMTAEKWLPTC